MAKVLKARVKKSFGYPSANACAGHEFIVGKWRDVPDGFEKEARNTTFLEVKMVDEDEINISKKAKELAEEHGIDIFNVDGSGSNGNITVDDIRALLPDED